MTRLMKFGILLAMLVAAIGSARPPNIIFILTDDLGYGDLSCFGQKLFQTPNIDRIATEGMKLTQHYSGSTVCAPSRCALMTGKHTGRAVVRGNREVQPIGQAPMPADTVTVAHLLKKAGYATGLFGKWGLGSPGSVSDPLKMGFDRFYGYNCQRNAHTFYPTWLFDDDEKIELDGTTYSHDLIVEEAFKFIRKNADKPFFTYWASAIPHAAMQAPEKYVAPFREQFKEYEDVIGKYSHGTRVKNPVAAFPGMMTKLDEEVGRLFALLKELDIDDNTLVIFTSDNGPHREGGHRPDIFNSSGPLTGLKRSVTEGGIRVPTLARWPGRIKPGTESDHISAFWDFLPTACEVAGIDAPDATDGISYLPALLGKDQKKHQYLYWEFHERGGKQALRMGKWKAIRRNTSKQADPPILLYNLDEDIAEKNDLAAKYPEIVDRMKRLMADAHRTHPGWLTAAEKQAGKK